MPDPSGRVVSVRGQLVRGEPGGRRRGRGGGRETIGAVVAEEKVVEGGEVGRGGDEVWECGEGSSLFFLAGGEGCRGDAGVGNGLEV